MIIAAFAGPISSRCADCQMKAVGGGTSSALRSFIRMPITTDIVAFSSDVHVQARAWNAPGNALVAALSSHHEEAFSLLKPHLEQLELNAGTVLQGSGAPITHVYFPTSGVVSCA